VTDAHDVGGLDAGDMPEGSHEDADAATGRDDIGAPDRSDARSATEGHADADDRRDTDVGRRAAADSEDSAGPPTPAEGGLPSRPGVNQEVVADDETGCTTSRRATPAGPLTLGMVLIGLLAAFLGRWR